MDTLTFDQLPLAVGDIGRRLEKIEELLSQKISCSSKPNEDILTVNEAAAFLSLQPVTIYSLISKGELPAMKRGKRCYFDRAELVQYLKAGRKKTNAEIEADVDRVSLKAKKPGL